MVRTNWVNWRTGLLAAVIAITVAAVFPRAGVHEVRNSSLPMNFPLVDPRPAADDWPWSRGTDGRNVSTSERFPMEWTSSQYEGWTALIPGHGNTTPVLWGNQLFLPSFENHPQRISLVCLQRKTGRSVWQAILHQGKAIQSKERLLRPASVVACDGQSVFVAASFDEKLWVTAVDLNGDVVWQREAGPYRAAENYASAPVVYKALVIVAADQAKDGYVAALHRQTGEIIWRVKRPHGEGFGSPVVATISGRAQLILAGTGSVKSYDPATGTELWTCRSTAERVSNTVAFDAERVFVTRGQANTEVVCIRADGQGDVTRTHVEWRVAQVGDETISPIQFEGLVYLLSDDGRLTCVEATSGKIEWTRKLKGTFAVSPLVVGGYLFCASESGMIYFVTLGTASPQVIENSFGTTITSDPIFAGDSIYLRTRDRIHRIAQPAGEPFVEKPVPPVRRL
jgi:outer membrane protein assembly factor BamB